MSRGRARLARARLTGTDGLRVAVNSKDRSSVVVQRKDAVLACLRDAGPDVAMTRAQIEDLTGVPVFSKIDHNSSFDPLNLLVEEGLVGKVFDGRVRENQLYYAEEGEWWSQQST